jgi:hypothetical protein
VFPTGNARVQRKIGRLSFRNARVNARAIAVSVFSPFLGLVLALLHPRHPAAKNLVWIFTIFYGTVFYIASGSGSDSVRYAETLSYMHNTGFELGDLVWDSPFYAGSYRDFYQPLVTFLVSRITDETWLLFGVFGILLGYVYSRNVWFLIEKLPSQPGLTIWGLIVAFAFVMNIGFSLNGVRMWTALHVFIFGVLFFADTGQRKYVLIALLSPLIHFSFMIPCVVLIAFLILKLFGTRIYGFGTLVYIFFVASFFIAAIEVELIRNAAQYLPFNTGDYAVRSYISRADPDGLTGSSEGQKAWFLVLNSTLVSVFIFLAATWLFLRKAHEGSNAVVFVFLFGMLSYGFVNLVAYIPSGARFFRVGEMLILAAVVLFLADQARATTRDFRLVAAALPLLGIHVALGSRFLLEFASVWLIAGNFFIAPFVDADVGLYEFIKSLL